MFTAQVPEQFNPFVSVIYMEIHIQIFKFRSIACTIARAHLRCHVTIPGTLFLDLGATTHAGSGFVSARDCLHFTHAL
jgi:hypothetical protein